MFLNTTSPNNNKINISKSENLSKISDDYMIIDVPLSTKMVDLKLNELLTSFLE